MAITGPNDNEANDFESNLIYKKFEPGVLLSMATVRGHRVESRELFV